MFDRLLSRVHHYHLCIEGDDNPGAGTGAGAGDGVDDKKLPADPGGTDDNPLLAPDDAGDAVDGDDPASPDWRAKFAGDDARELAWANRFTTEKNYVKAIRKMYATAMAGQAPAAPPEGATEAEIAAYRKTAGIPEKAEGYGVEFPADLKPSEGDKAVLGAILAKAHAKNVPTAHTQAVVGAYMEMAAEAAEAREEFVRQSEAETKVELIAEWGGRAEYNRTLTLGYELLEQHMGDQAPELAGMKLADGRPLGKTALFNRFLGVLARANADEGQLIGGDGGRGGKSIDDEYKELADKPKLTDAEYAKMMELSEKRVAREEKQGRRRSAA